ncbi:hypothetical protein HAV15_007918 [Penicillium sp. str. |nr:hypothetical protein HAV15_007918 [Penicillium sp. str. \
MSAVQVAHADFWYKTLPMLNRINFEPTIAIFPMIFVWLLAGRLDEIGRRRSAMALILLMLLSMQIPVVEFTGDPASMVSSVSQILLITLYQTVELVFSVYTAEVFPWQYNGVASNLPCGSNGTNSSGADLGMAITTSLSHGSIIAVTLGLSTHSLHDFFSSATYRSIWLLLSFLSVILLMKETKNVPIEDISHVFDLSTKNLILWRVKTCFRGKDIDLEPLESQPGAIRLE